jgi:hypothetical protein
VPEVLFEAVVELCPRDDRMPERRVFEGVTANRLRMAIARACTPFLATRPKLDHATLLR